jgi:hypothetical protein
LFIQRTPRTELAPKRISIKVKRNRHRCTKPLVIFSEEIIAQHRPFAFKKESQNHLSKFSQISMFTPALIDFHVRVAFLLDHHVMMF